MNERGEERNVNLTDEPEPARMRRSWVTGLVWVVTVPFVLWAMIRIGGFEAGWPLVQVLAYTPYALVLSLLVLLPVVLLRRWAAAFFLAVAVTGFALAVVPREFGSAGEVAGGQPVRILAANLYRGKADPEELLRLAESRDADLLVLIELKPDFAGKLKALGIDSLYPEQVLQAGPGAVGGGIYSRWPLIDNGRLDTRPVQPRAMVEVPASLPIEVVAVHPTAPAGPESTREWERDFKAMPAAGSSSVPLVLAGDFNATLDHANLRELLDTGYVSAGEAVGRGLVSTWPSKLKWPLPVTIDHILAERGIAVAEYDVEKINGSDHRAVYAELILPPVP